MSLPAINKKSFISICFYSSKLQVLQLDNKKNGVEKFASINLPKGLISNYKVRDKASLAKIVGGVWKQLGLPDKSVGLVVPEFSTFTKSVSLPKLEVKELDEAVRWQAHEFLPSSRDIVMDWKIYKKADKVYHIMVVAISEDVLSGYVDAVSLAGLYPLVVETPSLSLVRISDGNPTGKLAIYANYGEAILAISYGEEIIGSSVIASINQDEILRTAFQMLSHYREIEVKRIEVGGPEISKKLFSDLQTKLGRKVGWIKPGIVGMSSQQVQDFLIPISLQMKDPAEPANETTINLLPPKWAKQYQSKRFKN
jgi:hypothetical protein